MCMPNDCYGLSVCPLSSRFCPEPNQVQVFLDENGCAGVQHIAFHCDNIVSSVSCLRQNGVRFISPPPEYYSMVSQ